MRRTGILFRTDSVPFPNDDKDYSDQKERRGHTIIDEVVHSKHQGAHNQKESDE
jgi:hypothetical protein